MASHHANAQTNAARNSQKPEFQNFQQKQEQPNFHQQMPGFPTQVSSFSDESSWSGNFAGANTNCPDMMGHVPNHQSNSLGISVFDGSHCQKPVADAAASFFAK